MATRSTTMRLSANGKGLRGLADTFRLLAGISLNALSALPLRINSTNNGLMTTPASFLQAAADRHLPAAATAAVVTYAAAGAGISHTIRGLVVSMDIAPAAPVNLKVEDASGTTVFSVDLPAAAGVHNIPFPCPIKGSANTAMIVTLASGAGSVVGKVNVLGHSTETTTAV